MLTASDVYKAAILPGTAQFRRTAARVTLNVSEATMAYDTYTAINGEAGFSDVSKVTDGKINTYRIATCEPNFWRLDGSTVFSPAVAIDVGYASDALSLADGTFTSNPAVKITTSADFVSKGITLFFDQLSGEYPVEFDIDITYSVGPVNIYNISVTDNDSSYFMLSDWINAGYDQVDTITITFKKMSRGYCRARLAELFMGMQQVYGIGGSDDMISLSTTKQIDITDASLPHGDAVLKIDNSNGNFNLITPVGIAADLQAEAKMVTEYGAYISDGVIEYVKANTHLFTGWRDIGNKTVELNGVDTIGFYGSLRAIFNANYWSDSILSPRSYLNYILTDSGVPAAMFDLTPFPTGYGTDEFMCCPSADTVLDELRLMAQWLCKVCVCDQDGVIRFVDIGSVSASDVNLDDSYSDPTIERTEQIGGVDVNVYTATLNSDYTMTPEMIGVYKDTWTGYRVVKIEIGDYWGACSVTVDGEASYGSALAYDKNYYVEVVGAGNPITVTVFGYKYIVTKKLYSLDNSTADARAKRILIDNHHIYTETKAAEVAAWTLANYNKLLNLKYNWRGNPILEMGDMVTAETIHGNKDIIVTRQDLTFDGTLSGTLEGVG